MGTYTPILTNRGMELVLESMAQGTPLVLKYFTWGDGNGYPVVPNPAQTSLVNEVYRQQVTSVTVNGQVSFWLDILTIIPPTVGGFFVREVGIFTDTNELFAVAAHPDFYKNLPIDGTAVDFREKLTLEIINLTEVNITLTPSLITVTKDEMNAHKHNGESESPSKVDLTNGNEVKGMLPKTMVDGVVYSDGTIPMTATLNLGSNRIVNLANPSIATDACTKGYVDSIASSYNIHGLLVSNNIATPNTVVDINTGNCLDSTSTLRMTLTNILSKDLNNSWNLGNGGGLPPSLTRQPNTTYHLFIIAKPDGSVDGGFDTSLTASNLRAVASSYQYYRRIKSVVTDSSSNIIPEYSVERNDGSIECWIVPNKNILTTTTPAKVLTDLYTGIPLGIASRVKLDILYGASGTETTLEIKSKLTGSIIITCKTEASTTNELLEYKSSQLETYADTSGNIQYLTTGGTSENLSISTSYYIDNRK